MGTGGKSKAGGGDGVGEILRAMDDGDCCGKDPSESGGEGNKMEDKQTTQMLGLGSDGGAGTK